jgi:AraC-like DNA-binding protein
MQAFYEKALVALLCLLMTSVLVAYVCVQRSYLYAPVLPASDSAFAWHAQTNSDIWQGGKTTDQIVEAGAHLHFRFKISKLAEHPFAAAEIYFDDKKGKPILANLSRFSTLSLYVRCTPANTLTLSIPTFDPKVSRRDSIITYRLPSAYFGCGPHETHVELDLKHLEIPQWWFDVLKLDLSQHNNYQLDRVPKISIGSTFQSPLEVASDVEVRGLVLEGRDRRYLSLLAALLVLLWGGFAAWFFRAHSRALVMDTQSRLKSDLPLVAYQQLSLEPHRDKEKAAVLRYIATNYTDPNLDLEKVVAETGTNRNKINEILKAELGFTFTGYLNKLRLTEAARLLAEKDTAIVAEIAYSVGYSNVSYFNKLFKEEYGSTPKAFRRMCAN